MSMSRPAQQPMQVSVSNAKAGPPLSPQEHAAATSYYARVMLDSCEHSHGSTPGGTPGRKCAEAVTHAAPSPRGAHEAGLLKHMLLASISNPDMPVGSHAGNSSSAGSPAGVHSPMDCTSAAGSECSWTAGTPTHLLHNHLVPPQTHSRHTPHHTPSAAQATSVPGSCTSVCSTASSAATAGHGTARRRPNRPARRLSTPLMPPPSPFAAPEVQAHRPPPEPVKVSEQRRLAARRQSQDGERTSGSSREGAQQLPTPVPPQHAGTREVRLPQAASRREGQGAQQQQQVVGVAGASAGGAGGLAQCAPKPQAAPARTGARSNPGNAHLFGGVSQPESIVLRPVTASDAVMGGAVVSQQGAGRKRTSHEAAPCWLRRLALLCCAPGSTASGATPSPSHSTTTQGRPVSAF
eukprot:CAMPEP_0202880460 /NCGR_PEP_ID=MMETSP1391-20130828/35107_1 /ASSEMBLY_ACC=CAM_ASM_000867 /TAXON_ID=1034604 /ORGANISM="Chlamydomonas leiostraca, Strain SAG 11-49" /LENGTH=407 /DNA_ID=CAMNT_0049562979 /DNA_START=125 /DNA_END=1348 /DNA_ORIENTATION=-